MEYKNRVALVTGAAGTVGSRVAERLVSEGYEVRALVRRAADLPHTVTVIQGDLTDSSAVEQAMAGATLVVHAAAYIGYDWETARAANIEGTRHMLQAHPTRTPTGVPWLSNG